MNPEIRAMNLLRSDWAGAALASFVEQSGCDEGIEAIHDLLSDLGHFTEEEGYDFHELVEKAFGTWLLERSGLEAIARRPTIRIVEIGGVS